MVQYCSTTTTSSTKVLPLLTTIVLSGGTIVLCGSTLVLPGGTIVLPHSTIVPPLESDNLSASSFSIIRHA